MLAIQIFYGIKYRGRTDGKKLLVIFVSSFSQNGGFEKVFSRLRKNILGTVDQKLENEKDL